MISFAQHPPSPLKKVAPKNINNTPFFSFIFVSTRYTVHDISYFETFGRLQRTKQTIMAVSKPSAERAVKDFIPELFKSVCQPSKIKDAEKRGETNLGKKYILRDTNDRAIILLLWKSAINAEYGKRIVRWQTDIKNDYVTYDALDKIGFAPGKKSVFNSMKNGKMPDFPNDNKEKITTYFQMMLLLAGVAYLKATREPAPPKYPPTKTQELVDQIKELEQKLQEKEEQQLKLIEEAVAKALQEQEGAKIRKQVIKPSAKVPKPVVQPKPAGPPETSVAAQKKFDLDVLLDMPDYSKANRFMNAQAVNGQDNAFRFPSMGDAVIAQNKKIDLPDAFKGVIDDTDLKTMVDKNKKSPKELSNAIAHGLFNKSLVAYQSADMKQPIDMFPTLKDADLNFSSSKMNDTVLSTNGFLERVLKTIRKDEESFDDEDVEPSKSIFDFNQPDIDEDDDLEISFSSGKPNYMNDVISQAVASYTEAEGMDDFFEDSD